jgi:4-aminobutyrate aminotransferase
MLIADEVQTGFARTGKLFAMQQYDVLADLITMAKSLAGGMPLSGVVGRADVMDAAAPGGLGGTYAGNPLAVASAHAVLDIIDEEAVRTRDATGRRAEGEAERAARDIAPIADVRGPARWSRSSSANPATGEPDADFTKRVQARALERGLLLLVCGVYSNVVRFLFPLTIPQAVFDEALTILEEVLKETVGVPA